MKGHGNVGRPSVSPGFPHFFFVMLQRNKFALVYNFITKNYRLCSTIVMVDWFYRSYSTWLRKFQWIKIFTIHTDCVQEYRTTSGSITSDNYPGAYNSNTDCLYIIKPPPGLYSLKTDVFQMADSGDFLEVRLV